MISRQNRQNKVNPQSRFGCIVCCSSVSVTQKFAMSSQICYFPEAINPDKAIAKVLSLPHALPHTQNSSTSHGDKKAIHYFPEMDADGAVPDDLNTLTTKEQAIAQLTTQVKEKLGFEEAYMDTLMQLDVSMADEAKAETLLQDLISTTVKTTVTEVQATPEQFQLEHPKSPWLPGYLKQWQGTNPEAEQTALKKEQLLQLGKIGQLLKRTRVKRGLSHTRLHHMTHIMKGHIVAIELGELHKLPEPLYIKGFIRRLGDALELNGEAIAATFPMKQERTRCSTNKPHQVQAWQVEAGRYVGYTALMMGAISGLSWSLNNAQRTITPVGTMSPPSINQASDEVAPQIVQTEAKITPPEMMSTP